MANPRRRSAHPTPSGMVIAYRSLRELTPYARNARKHTALQIRKLRSSLARFGWTNPMLIADDQMIAGHARLAAAIEMAEASQAIPRNPDPWSGPTIDLSHLSHDERVAYTIADNRIAQDAGWDNDLLRMDLLDLQRGGFDLALTGFATTDVAAILSIERVSGRSLTNDLKYQIVIDCDGEAGQATLLADLRSKGLICRPLIL